MPSENHSVPKSGEAERTATTAGKVESQGEYGFKPLVRPELVFAVVGAVGTDLSLVCEVLKEHLDEVGYRDAFKIRLSERVRSFERYKDISEAHADERIWSLMNAGDDLRKTLERGDAMALLAVTAVRAHRKSITGHEKEPAPAKAYILHSLKHPDEVATLRRIYGRAFHLIAAFSGREARVSALATRIAKSYFDFDEDKYRPRAEELVKRDEADSTKILGQDVRDTYPLADLFVDATNRDALSSGIGRFVDLLFGHPFNTPTPDEFGMFHARASSLLSADLSRQVGAVITQSRGEIVSVGCNDVPRPGGGGYWPEDIPDVRDFVIGYDPSAKVKKDILAEVFHLLQENGWFSENKKSEEINTLVDQALKGNQGAILKDAQIMNILEFGRIVHAEMSAIAEAARRGLSVKGATLYCTTFPCHICARHIVASGISRVVYIEPYPKSMAQKLYPEAISVNGRGGSPMAVKFEPFLGISPSRYFDLFEMTGARKNKNGDAIQWKRMTSSPRLERMVGSYLEVETLAIGALDAGAKLKGLRTA